MAHQLSLFVENRPGKMDAVLDAVVDKKIDIKAFSITSSDTFGVIKLLVDEPFKVREMLKDAGFTVALEEVVVMEFDSVSGRVREVTRVLATEGINIDNAYGFVGGQDKKMLFVAETAEAEKIKQLFTGRDVKILNDAQIYSL